MKKQWRRRRPRYGSDPKWDHCRVVLFVCCLWELGKGVSKQKHKKTKQMSWFGGWYGDGGRKGKRRETQTVSLFILLCVYLDGFCFICLFFWYLSFGWPDDGWFVWSFILSACSFSLTLSPATLVRVVFLVPLRYPI